MYFLVILYLLDCSHIHQIQFNCWWQPLILTAANEHDSHLSERSLLAPCSPAPHLLTAPHSSHTRARSLEVSPGHGACAFTRPSSTSLLIPGCSVRNASLFGCQLLTCGRTKPVYLLWGWDREGTLATPLTEYAGERLGGYSNTTALFCVRVHGRRGHRAVGT